MARDGFDRVNGTSPELDRAQRRIQDGQDRGRRPFDDGVEVELEIDDNTTKKVSHKLGRKPKGYMKMTEKGDGIGALQLVESSTRDITFKLSIPSGAPLTTHQYTIWVY